MPESRFYKLNCLLTFSFLFILITQVQAQESTGRMSIGNSFTFWMALDNPSESQLDSIVNLSIDYLFKNQDTCMILAKRAIVKIEKRYQNQPIHAKALLQIGDAYRVGGEAVEAAKYYEEGKAIYQSLNMESDVAFAYTKLGTISMNLDNFEESIEYHLKALEIWETARDTNNIFRPYINIAEVFYYLGRKDKAYEYNSKALEIGRIRNAEALIALTLGNQAILEKELGEQYNSIADTISSNSQLYRDSAQLFFNRAMENNEFSLLESRKENDKRGELEILENIIELKTATKAYGEAINHGKEAEKIAKELGSNEHVLQVKLFMADAYRISGQPKFAILQGEAALKLPDTENRRMERSQVNKVLYQAYKDLGQTAKALTNYEAFTDYQQQTSETEQNRAIADIEAKYQTVQKEKQLLEQQSNIMLLESENAKIEKQRNYLFGGTLFISMFGLLGFYFNKIRKERNDKIAFAKALIYAQEAERKRIARDLHDGVGQSLLLIKKQMETSQETTLENKQLITDTLEEVRSISQDLHPLLLEKFGLTAAIDEVINKVEKTTDLFISREITNIDNLLFDKAEINLFRTIQEALNNIIKHSEATAAKVSIHSNQKELAVTIQDNGKGFDHELAIITSKSLGLRTMYERIATLGGKLTIEKGMPKGTKIRIIIPINK